MWYTPEAEESVQKWCPETFKGRNHLGDIPLDEKIILKWIG